MVTSAALLLTVLPAILFSGRALPALHLPRPLRSAVTLLPALLDIPYGRTLAGSQSGGFPGTFRQRLDGRLERVGRGAITEMRLPVTIGPAIDRGGLAIGAARGEAQQGGK